MNTEDPHTLVIRVYNKLYNVALLLYVAVQSVVNKMSDMGASFTVIALITEKGRNRR